MAQQLSSLVQNTLAVDVTNITGTIPVLKGGTGATTAASALTNLGAYAASNPSGYTTNTGTVTSVAALTLGTTGTDVTSTVATGTTTPVITFNLPTASATNRGALSAADWTTFNTKQAALGFTPENVANKGAANGYAPLDATSKISSTYLPSYIDDVLEYANLAAFPATGTAGLIYVTVDTNKTYRWSGSAYVEISASSPGTAGSNTQVQYNSSGVFGASSGLTFDGTVLTSNTLTVSNTSYVVKPFKLITQSNAKLTIGVGDATSTVAIVALNAAETGYQDITIQGNNFVRLHTGGTSRLAVDVSGNVGIGTISPGSKLSVVGQIESTLTGYKFPDGTVQATAATGGGAWEKITANTTATTKKQYVTDTTAGAFIVTLPATPAAGDYVYFMDAGNWATNNLTVARNGKTIEASDTDLVLDVRGLMVQLIYDGSTWQVMSNIGPQGPIGPAQGVGKVIAMAMIFGG